MLLKCVQGEDRSGYIQKKNLVREYWGCFFFRTNEKNGGGWGGDDDEKEEREKEKTRDEATDSSSLWVSVCGSCQKKQGWESNFSRELRQETLFLQREVCRSTAMAHSQNLLVQNTSTSSSFKSLYVSPSFSFSPGQNHIPSTGLCIFSDFPGLGFRPKKLGLGGITFHTCACLQGWRAMKTRSHMSREGRVC